MPEADQRERGPRSDDPLGVLEEHAPDEEIRRSAGEMRFRIGSRLA
ncbi:hypothetical protein [Streptomyces sp. R33]|uniref:Uncharacterized protein n=1 Tax=Streptomyces sp. R33 TaxID=3238629 RepID=A0AB39YE76_9ACTN